MADDDTYEDFDINETDFQYAMNPGSYKRLSKKKQIYGIWASDSEDEDARPSFSGSKKPNYSTPVSFVSGGVQQAGAKKENTEETDERVEEIKIDEERPPPTKKTKPFRPSFQQSQKGAQVFAGMRQSATKGTLDPGAFGNFLKNGSQGDVIMKMMQKMGYEQGKGLGASKQGIVEPIQPKVRPGRGAVGAYGAEAKGPKFGESAAEAQRRIDGAATVESTETVTEVKRGNWKKENRTKKEKVTYKTLEDVVNDGGDTHRFKLNTGTSMKIIDMTGPQQRVYNDFNSFSRRAAVPETGGERTNFDVPELMYNLNTLIDMTEDEILRNDRQIRFLKDQNVALEMEEENLRKEVAEEREEIRRMNDVVEIIEEFDRLSKEQEPSLNDCKNLFIRLKEEFPTEYKLYGLDIIAVANVLPLIKSYFAAWNPLDPDLCEYGIEVLKEWRQILADNKAGIFDHFKNDLDSLPVYDRCVWEGWMPSIRRASLAWNPRTDGPVMINLIESWLTLLPRWISENLLEQVITLRIKDLVDQWNPMTDNIPIESWLLPWHPIMGDRLMPVYPIIRQKLAKALREWVPIDKSALEILKPWKMVFSQGAMQSFLSMNIVPKLERFLAEMDLDPTRNKEYIEFYAVLSWVGMISTDIICQILVKNFFPRWYNNLCIWLDAGGVLAEVGEYYKEWKLRIPTPLAEMKPIKDEFLRALVAMQQASKGLKVSQIQLSTGPTPLMQTPIPPLGSQFPPRLPPTAPAPMNVPTNFRQVVEQRARQLGILFVPQPNKYEDGRQIYSFGKMSIFFEGNVVYAFDPIRRAWNPISLDHLISVCQ